MDTVFGDTEPTGLQSVPEESFTRAVAQINEKGTKRNIALVNLEEFS